MGVAALVLVDMVGQVVAAEFFGRLDAVAADVGDVEATADVLDAAMDIEAAAGTVGLVGGGGIEGERACATDDHAHGLVGDDAADRGFDPLDYFVRGEKGDAPNGAKGKLAGGAIDRVVREPVVEIEAGKRRPGGSGDGAEPASSFARLES